MNHNISISAKFPYMRELYP